MAERRPRRREGGRVSDAIPPPAGDVTLVLVRHGETDAIRDRRFQGRADTPLSARGRRQAALVADRLAGRTLRPPLPLPVSPPRRIVHSPLSRAADTAAAIAAAFRTAGADVPLVTEVALAEIGQGAWEGMRLEEIEAEHGAALAAWRRAPWVAHAPGGEALAQADARVRAWLGPALASLAGATESPRGGSGRPQVLGYEDETPDVPWAVLVAHVGVFKVLLLALLDLPLTAFWRFPFAPAAITIVEIRDGTARLRLHNAAEHLAPLLDEDPTRLRPSDAL
jgi:broad specificity phosphatase PhoE